ncbi:pilus assembly protein CpaE [Isoptericola croceus]|uniref:pilus assembly protein CpaE n=1 Tax=Isoptericola croceus TaxID=3031406 RepID=UPI0023F9318D|nr:pilus assembly protein CpaE [Isoptericola croceus]
MISTELATRLRDAGLTWKPTEGDRFHIDAPELAAEVFTVSTLTIEAHHFPTGTVLGFNGTTEWALDSVDIEDTLWLPREDQLRDLLGRTFRSMVRDGESYIVEADLLGQRRTFTATDPADAYGRALLALVELAGE